MAQVRIPFQLLVLEHNATVASDLSGLDLLVIQIDGARPSARYRAASARNPPNQHAAGDARGSERENGAEGADRGGRAPWQDGPAL
jgi:hypothetical protein